MEKEEFWDLWEDQKKFLLSVCLKYTENYHNAQDLLSEVMVKAYKKVTRQILDTNPGGWLVQLIKNTYIDQYRHTRKCQVRICYTSNCDRFISENDDSALTPIDKIFLKEVWQYLEKGFESIPPRRRHFTKLYFSGYSYNEICNSFDVTPEALRQMICLSRHEMRKSLESYQNGKALKKSKKEGIKYYNHILQHQENGYIHYFDFVSKCSPNRLKQKAENLLKYVASHPNSNDGKFKLAINLSSQGKIYSSLKILRDLISSNYLSEEVFDLQIKLLNILQREEEIIRSTEKAISLLPGVPCRFYVWQSLAKGDLERAESIIKANLSPETNNLTLHLLLVKIYQLQGKKLEAYAECEEIHQYHPWHPEIYNCDLENKIIFDGYFEARGFAMQYLKHNPTSAIGCLNHLHFLVSSGQQRDNSELSTLFTNVRKRYNWHPDFALIKALLTPEKTNKILVRRCADYPSCALSKHYLNLITPINTPLPDLTAEESNHLSLIKIIYTGKIRRDV